MYVLHTLDLHEIIILCVLYSIAAFIQLLIGSKSFQPCTKSDGKYLVSVSSCPYTMDISSETHLRNHSTFYRYLLHFLVTINS